MLKQLFERMERFDFGNLFTITATVLFIHINCQEDHQNANRIMTNNYFVGLDYLASRCIDDGAINRYFYRI